jgi:hypothetical protein
VSVDELTEDHAPLSGLLVIVRMPAPNRHRAVWQQLALTAELVTVFDTSTKHCEYLAA